MKIDSYAEVHFRTLTVIRNNGGNCSSTYFLNALKSDVEVIILQLAANSAIFPRLCGIRREARGKLMHVVAAVELGKASSLIR